MFHTPQRIVANINKLENNCIGFLKKMHVLPHYREMCAKHCTPLGQNVQEKNVIFCIFFLQVKQRLGLILGERRALGELRTIGATVLTP